MAHLIETHISIIEYSLEAEIRNNRTILSTHKNISIYVFWIHVEKVHWQKNPKNMTEIFNVIFMLTRIIHANKYKNK